jgi:hypothetical protein
VAPPGVVVGAAAVEVAAALEVVAAADVVVAPAVVVAASVVVVAAVIVAFDESELSHAAAITVRRSAALHAKRLDLER